MTKQELREHSQYIFCMNRIRTYQVGFTWTMNWEEIPPAKANALKIILEDAKEIGLIESIKMTYDINLKLIAETYRRI